MSRTFSARCALLLLVAVAVVGGTACSSTAEDQPRSGSDAVTAIDDTPVKEQLVGTCWLYTTAAWAEALHLKATGETVDLSESYWTYWTFFERIIGGEVDPDGWLEETGTWGFAAEMIARYGLMKEGDFIPEEGESLSSNRTADAYNAILTSLAVGKLTSAASRRDRALVRSELDVAFGLRSEVVTWMNDAFGEDGRRTIGVRGNVPSGVPIIRARDFSVAAEGGRTKTLFDYVGYDLADINPNKRAGIDAWKQVLYPAANASEAAKRKVLGRVQRSLNDGLPVIVSWRVDQKAVEPDGTLRATAGGNVRSGAHLSLITDYQASNVPGFGVLPVGIPETRGEARLAALDDAAVVDLLRIKNSWGARPRQDTAIPPGYYDIYRAYFDASFDVCTGGDCKPARALHSVILPAGY